MTVNITAKHILKKGDLHGIKKDLDKMQNIHGAVVGGVSGGSVGGPAGAVSGALLGGFAELIAEDVINNIEDVLNLEEYSKTEMKNLKRESKAESLAIKRLNKKVVAKDDSWFGGWW